jgi:hypothetical protein
MHNPTAADLDLNQILIDQRLEKVVQARQVGGGT